MGKASILIYITLALVLIFFLTLFQNKKHSAHHRHRRLRLRSDFTLNHHDPVAFDPLVAELERHRQDKQWEKQHIHQSHPELVLHDSAPGHESQPEWEDSVDDEDYLNDEDKFNVTDRLVLLFPKIDVDPTDGFVTEHELTQWNLQQAQTEVLHRTQREMDLHDKNHDGFVSFSEYHPPTWDQNADNNSFGYDMGWWKEEHFNASDADGNGLLNLTEFNDFLHPADSKNPKLHQWLCKEEVRERDTDKDGKVNFKEFFHGLFDSVRNYDEESHNDSHHSDNSMDAPARVLFAQLDKDGDGYLSDVEILPIIGKIHPSEHYYAKQQADYIISQADIDKDGRLTLTEMIENPYVFYSAIFNDDEDEDEDEYDFHDEFRILMFWPRLARRTTWQVGREDPRRVVHSLKVGLAFTLVSLLYLMEPLFKGIGKNAMWAVMTVVVVMEFTVGATLCKGLNRGLGTLLAGSLAFLFEYVADYPGRIFRAVFIGASVFLIGAAATYVRFIPYIKKNYDYGVLIFLLTFNLITVSSYRVDDVWNIAKDRISTIAIGCGLCLVISLLVFPNWSGEDLHNSTISKLEGLANSIEVCVMEYFYGSEKQATQDDSSEDPIYEGYKAVLDSKAKDETLALQASWEPRFTRYCHRIPWQQYARVGAALRHFSYSVVALHGCLQSEIQTPGSIRTLYKDSCIRLAEEVCKVLLELANSIRNNRQFSSQMLSNNLKEALQDLNSALKSQPQLFLRSRKGLTTNTTAQAVAHPEHQNHEEDSRPSLSSVKSNSSSHLECKSKEHSPEHSKEGQKKVLRPQLSKIAITTLEFSEALPFAAFTSLLVEMVAKLDHVLDEVEELGRIAHFREFRDDDDEIVVTCERPKMHVVHNDMPPSYGEE